MDHPADETWCPDTSAAGHGRWTRRGRAEGRPGSEAADLARAA